MIAGYVLACDECARRTFYRADQVTQRFVCERCSHDNLVPADARRSLQPNEAFYRLHRNHGSVVTFGFKTPYGLSLSHTDPDVLY
jgi:DNA-directed RNA polymerase subunit RPC12/RpoP